MKISRYIIALLIILSITGLPGCQQVSPSASITDTLSPTGTPSGQVNSGTLQSNYHDATGPPTNNENTTTVTASSQTRSQLTVSFLDVGQADCIIIRSGNSNMIIDAGGNATASSLVEEIKSLDITGFDAAVGTHPHEDHIGGLDAVINNFDIGAIYMPKVSANTRTFEDVLTAIQNKGLKVTTPAPGSSLTLGKAVQWTILAPNSSSYSDLNSYSIVIKLVYGNTSFLFTGDAGTDSEKEMLDKGYDLKADVLKVGHHGSTYSTSREFLQAVAPEYAVISVGQGNTYGHPHQKTLDKLAQAGVQVYRTDLSGTIVFTSDGNNLKITTNETGTLPSNTTPPVITSPALTSVPGTTATGPAESDLTLNIVSVTSPVSAGHQATLTAKTAPGAECKIKVYYKSGPSSAGGLESKTADSGGNASWTWKVAANTTPGNYQIVVEATLNGETVTRTTTFTVQ